MPAAELELMLGAAAWRLQAGADDPALTPDALREMARDSAMLLQQMRPELAALRLALEQAQAGERDSFDSRLNGARGAREHAPRPLAVLLLDLDRLKHVSDHHGHAVDDALLRVVAKRVRSAVRATDRVCRLGGGEFACLVAGPLGPLPSAAVLCTSGERLGGD
jgi:diguanylate cyclase